MFLDKRRITGKNTISVAVMAINDPIKELPKKTNEIINAATANAIPTP